MALRWKVSNPMTVVTATEMQHIADNGVVQIDTAADLDSPNLVGANVAYSKADFKAHKRVSAGVGSAHWKTLGGANEATGGTITEIDNYNGTGQKWRLHTFDTNADFTVTGDSQPFHLLIVGGGGGSGAPAFGQTGGSGGGGAVIWDQAAVIPAGVHAVVVGSGGPGGNEHGHHSNGPGGVSSISTFTAGGGGEGGTGHDGTHGRPGGAPNGGTGGSFGPYGEGGSSNNPNIISNITGTDVTYGVGGGWVDGNGGATMPPGRGIGGDSHRGGVGDTGGSGIVIVAYQIG